MQDVRRRGDRVAAEHHLDVGQLTGGDEAVGQRGVAGDLPVLAGWQLRRRDLVGGAERLGGLAVVPARLQRQHVGLGDVGLAGELLPDERLAGLDRPAVHPRQQAEREHVLGALAVLLGRADRLDRTEGQRGHRDGVHDVVGELVGLQRVGLVAHLGEVALGELVGVGDHQSAARQVADVGLQRGGVHRDEDVGTVAGGQDVVVGDLDLERRDAGQRALRRADLGGVIRLGRKVVAEQRGLGGEPVTGELHAVAGVAGESDDDVFQALPFGRRAVMTRPGRHCHSDPRLRLPLILRTGTSLQLQVTRRRNGSLAITIFMSLAVPIMTLL